MTGVAVPRRLVLALLLGYSLFLAFALLAPDLRRAERGQSGGSPTWPCASGCRT